MAQTPTAQTNPEVDRIVEKLSRWLSNTPADAKTRLSLSREESQWLRAEIEGGREAFGAIVDSNTALRERVATMQASINTLMTMRR